MMTIRTDIRMRAAALYAARHLPPDWHVPTPDEIDTVAAGNRIVHARWRICKDDAANTVRRSLAREITRALMESEASL